MPTEHSPTGADRVVLEGVPRVGFYPSMRAHSDSQMRCPEDVPLPSCLRACLEYLGDGLGCRKIGLCSPEWQLGCGYAYLMGASGAAFRLTWKPGWHGDNVASFLASDDPSEVCRRAFAAVGYDCGIICGSELATEGRDKAEYMRSRIIESIRDRLRPVIAYGVVGPPEECIVTGYDEGGEVLIGWSFFQDGAEFRDDLEFEPNGYFRKRDWFESTKGLLVIGNKQEQPDLKRVYLDALRFALRVARDPRRGSRHNGLAAYDAWAEHLLTDEEFATDDLDVLRQRYVVHDDATLTVAEGRWYASIFLAQAAMDAGLNAPELYAAASCYAAEHDLMWDIWRIVGGGHDEAAVRKLAEPDARRQIVPIIREARDRDAEAAEHLERVLAAQGA
jgi:hypothetical protein